MGKDRNKDANESETGTYLHAFMNTILEICLYEIRVGLLRLTSSKSNVRSQAYWRFP